MLQFTLRLGDPAPGRATTTPRNVPLMKELMARPGRWPDAGADRGEPGAPGRGLPRGGAGRATPAPGWGGRSWTASFVAMRTARSGLRRCSTIAGAGAATPELDRVVVAVDPPVTSRARRRRMRHRGRRGEPKGPPQDWRAEVLADASVAGASPHGWAEARRWRRWSAHGADRMVAEVNQGGEHGRKSILRTVAPLVPYRAVHGDARARRCGPSRWRRSTSRGGWRMPRADPALEDADVRQMTAGGVLRARAAPDRLDALVWALTELMIGPAADWVKRGAASEIRLL